MYKVMVLIKRRPGMTMEEFVDYCETRHALLGATKVHNMKATCATT